MLDAGLDVSPLMNFVPLPLVQGGKFSKLPNWIPREGPAMSAKLGGEIKEIGGKVFLESEPEFNVPKLTMLDMAEVDVILVSNLHCMMALPYITEYTSFRGEVFATEPTLHIGRLFMEEMVEYIERVPKLLRATKWKQANVQSCLPSPLRDAVSPGAWRRCYSNHDIQSCLSKVQKVGFSEKKDVFGAVTITAASSGFCLGSCNWTIHSDYEKIGYISGSSTLTTHPKPMDQAPLRNSDVLIMCSLSQTPMANPDAMIGEFCVNAAMTLKNGGNVLVPCYPSGVTYDLFECLSGHLESCGLLSVPMYFISPVAKSSLAYSNIYSEWLSTGKKNKVYLPEPPFPHAELVKNARLRHYASLHDGFNNDLKTPAVVFTGHPSLRFGNVVHFLELWGKSSSNTLIVTEPDFAYLDALAPYQPLAMKVAYCPIDTSLSFAQANKLIKDLKPLHMIVPEQYTTPPTSMPHRTDLVIDCEPPPATIKQAEVITPPIKRRFEKVDLDAEFAASLVPNEVKPGVSVAMLTGTLSNRDNKFTLKPVSKSPTPSTTKKRKLDSCDTRQPTYAWGTVDVYEFVDNLKKQAITDVTVEDSPGGGHTVHLPSEDSLIQIEDGSTHIICGNESLRVQLRDTLLKCLEKL
ncbi:hypothetical protein NP493_439g04033 [Ridgeia piscesae]|uniref:Beta-Casp domain-containing protein n=1 Tax=Ridgeia piscesae TaxID=27915 RepID=A0AAD9L031_RIDPI|nr:hypothetical protein NP493_439g04033 [Ridgeia piscesae]